MTRNQFITEARRSSPGCALYMARAAGVTLAQCQLWILTMEGR